MRVLLAVVALGVGIGSAVQIVGYPSTAHDAVWIVGMLGFWVLLMLIGVEEEREEILRDWKEGLRDWKESVRDWAPGWKRRAREDE